mgnify:CR=1 FL=1
MNGKKFFLLVTVFVAMLLLVGVGVEVAQAGGQGKTDPTPNHVPVCQKIPVTGREYYELRCSDRGSDIVDVQVSTNGGYKLDWSDDYVHLIVYATSQDPVTASWSVSDQAGNVVAGKLP